MADTAALTLLQVANSCRRCAGYPGLSAYPSASPDEPELAATDFIEEAVRQLANKQNFPWNTVGDPTYADNAYTFTPTSTKIILEPTGSPLVPPYAVAGVQLHPDYSDSGRLRVEVRTDPSNSNILSLYNVTDSTFVWSGSVKCIVQWRLTFTNLPDVARYWVMMYARRQMAGSFRKGDSLVLENAMRDERIAWIDLQNWRDQQSGGLPNYTNPRNPDHAYIHTASRFAPQ